MLKTVVVAGILSLTCGAVLSANAQEAPQHASPHVTSDASLADALIRRDLARELLSNRLPPISSREGLAAFMRVAESGHPLRRLSPPARRRFLESLTFNENGLTGYRYDELLAELPASEIYQVLSLLGAQDTAPFLGKGRVVDDLDRVAVQSFGFGGDVCDQEGLMSDGSCSDDIPNAKCVGRGTCHLHHLGYVCRSTC